MIDTNTQFGQRVARRLVEERVIWLTTVDSQGTPQPRPVWFLWDGNTFLIYSQPETHKLEHIRHHPQVALSLNADSQGNDIVVFTGEARIAEEERPANEVSAYADRYREGFKNIGMTAEEFARSYSVALWVRPTSLRGH
jgi:PPOX class probable F420-dependent enzyme